MSWIIGVEHSYSYLQEDYRNLSGGWVLSNYLSSTTFWHSCSDRVMSVFLLLCPLGSFSAVEVGGPLQQLKWFGVSAEFAPHLITWFVGCGFSGLPLNHLPSLPLFISEGTHTVTSTVYYADMTLPGSLSLSKVRINIVVYQFITPLFAMFHHYCPLISRFRLSGFYSIFH